MTSNHRESTSSPSGESDFEDVKLSCELCRAVFSGSRPYEQHLKGSAHKKAAMKAKYRRQHDLAKKALAAGGAVPGPLEGAASDEDEGVAYTCVACQKVCSGHVSYELHLAGRLHRKQRRRVQLEAALEQDGCKGAVPHDALYDEAPELKPYAGCEACGKTFSGPEAMKGHLESGAHKKAVRDRRLLQELRDGDAQFRKPDGDGDDDDEEALPFCPDCGKIFSGPLPYRQHMLSDAHKRQVRNLRHLSKVKDLVVQVEGEAVFRCADCGSSFSGPKPFRQHLRGHGHQKSLRKVKVMDDIRARFPEVVEQQGNDDGEEEQPSDDSREEEGEVRGSVLSCGVCHKAFSGPENAREHFTSKKHLNAVREKKKIDRILQKKRRGKAEGAGPRTAAAAPPTTPEGHLGKKSILRKGAKEVESVSEAPDSDEEFEQILFPKH